MYRFILLAIVLSAQPTFSQELAVAPKTIQLKTDLSAICRREVAQLNCDQLPLEANDKTLLRTCNEPDDDRSFKDIVWACASSAGGAWTDGLKSVIHDVQQQAKANLQVPRFLQQCMKSTACLTNLFEAIHSRLPDAREVRELNQIQYSWLPAPGVQMQNLWERAIHRDGQNGPGVKTTNPWVLQQVALMFPPPPPPSSASAESFFKKVSNLASQKYRQFRCFNSEGRSAMGCYLAFSVIDPVLATSMVSKVPSLGRMLKMVERENTRFAGDLTSQTLLPPAGQITTAKAVVAKKSFEEIMSDFPALAQTLEKFDPTTLPQASIKHPREIPFAESNPYRAIKDKEMLLRAEGLSPTLQNTITATYNRLGNPEETSKYLRQLFKESAEHMAARGKKSDQELLKAGKIDPTAMAVVLIKRAKARGDQIGRITDGQLLTGNRLERARMKAASTDPNSHFRNAIQHGPFFDGAFSLTDRYSHGELTHLMQRDMVTEVVAKSTGGQSQEFWNFLGSKKGVHWWVDLFDSGVTNSLHRPEKLQESVIHAFSTDQ